MCRMESSQKSSGKWVLLVFNCAAFCIGGTAGSLLTRFYFMHGGNCKWLIAWLQTAGCPLLIVPIWIYSIIIKSSENESTHVTPKLCLASIVLGLLTGLHNFLYSWGIAYLPLSTATLLVSPQLAFIAIFAIFLVKQRFTPFSINALVLLTMAAIMLALHASGDRPEGVTSTQYWLGFFATGGGAALYGFILPLIEFVYRKSTRRITTSYIVIMEMQVIMSISATLFCTLGMLVNKDFQGLGSEGRSFDVGEFNYYMSLVWNAICWQLYFIGLYGVIFLTSSLFSGVFMASLTPLVEVLSVVILHEKFRGEKVMAFALALWGFTSYLFGEYKSSTLQTSNTSEEHAHPHEGLESTEIEEIDERTTLLGIEEGSYPHYA